MDASETLLADFTAEDRAMLQGGSGIDCWSSPDGEFACSFLPEDGKPPRIDSIPDEPLPYADPVSDNPVSDM